MRGEQTPQSLNQSNANISVAGSNFDFIQNLQLKEAFQTPHGNGKKHPICLILTFFKLFHLLSLETEVESSDTMKKDLEHSALTMMNLLKLFQSRTVNFLKISILSYPISGGKFSQVLNMPNSNIGIAYNATKQLLYQYN